MAQKYKLIFMDGTVEEVEAMGPAVAWIKGKIRATEKRTYLLKVEEVHGSSKKFHVRYIDLTTGKTEEKVISEIEQHDLYKQQREGKISIISITALK